MTATAIVAVAIGHAAVVDFTAIASASVDAANGMSYSNGGQQMLVFDNSGNANPVTCIVAWGPGGVVDGIAPAAQSFVIASSTRKVLGPFPAKYYSDAGNLVQLSFTGTVTGSKIGVATVAPV